MRKDLNLVDGVFLTFVFLFQVELCSKSEWQFYSKCCVGETSHST